MGSDDRLIQAGGRWVPSKTVILPVWIDLTLSIEEMIRLGKYANEKGVLRAVGEDRFPIERDAAPVRQYWETVLLVPPYRKGIRVPEQAVEMQRGGLPHGSVVHTLAIGAQYPDLPYRICGWGSIWPCPGGHLVSPALYQDDGKRKLGLHGLSPVSRLRERDRCVVRLQQAVA